MRIAMFYHSLISDWNHGNAHFLRGVVTELMSRGHDVTVYEPEDAWSVENLRRDHGEEAIGEFRAFYPHLKSSRYNLQYFDVNKALDDVDMVIVHEWTDPGLVRRIGKHRSRNHNYILLFHDTHHRAITSEEEMSNYDLSHYDGVLAFGAILKDIYIKRGWTGRAFTWHEAADTRIFHPVLGPKENGDLVWIGNWGDEERTEELHEFLLNPVKKLGLKAKVYGVRYPEHALKALKNAGIEYGGWLPNYNVPHIFACYKVTVHVPRRPYVESLPGIPTIRPFEAMACGIPLVCSPWSDVENLFTPGKDYLVARDGREMRKHLKRIIEDDNFARKLADHAMDTIHSRHTCAHRVEELLNIYTALVGESELVSARPAVLESGERG